MTPSPTTTPIIALVLDQPLMPTYGYETAPGVHSFWLNYPDAARNTLVSLNISWTNTGKTSLTMESSRRGQRITTTITQPSKGGVWLEAYPKLHNLLLSLNAFTLPEGERLQTQQKELETIWKKTDLPGVEIGLDINEDGLVRIRLRQKKHDSSLVTISCPLIGPKQQTPAWTHNKARVLYSSLSFEMKRRKRSLLPEGKDIITS